MALRKYDKNLRPVNGFRADPDAVRRAKEAREERAEKKAVKAAKRRLEAQGFEFDKFKKHVERFTK